jgi:hypothetical protein
MNNKKRFSEYTDQELIDVFNCDVGNSGWVFARAKFIAELHNEFKCRNFDTSDIIQNGAMSLAHKIKLDDGKIAKI